MPVDYETVLPEDRETFEDAFQQLLKLQTMLAKTLSLRNAGAHFDNSGENIRPATKNTRTEKDGLYPLQTLVQPVSLRFKYHFEGTRQTNKLDKVLPSF